ncbi:MAG: UDP-galactopyranose mutase [Candidatus Woesearchaeota archaeon]
MKILVVGSGFSGAVVARQLAEKIDAEVLVIDRRNHIAGNCHTERDSETNIMVHKYGAHIFHTSNRRVWDYVQKFGEFHQFMNRPKASISSGIYSLPINLHTINQFFSLKLNPKQAQEFIESRAEKTITQPQNFEEQALKFMGKELYQAFFYGYTKKQWGCDPKELPASILKRIPIRFNYDDNYYRDFYQGIPVDGYTAIISRILSHENISTKLNTSWEPNMINEFDHVFFTGPLDAFYNFKFGRLSYRTVYWDRSVHTGDFQGNPGINYPELKFPFTRMREHKHYTPWENHEKTVVFTEYSKETGPEDEPYYPKRLQVDKEKLSQYKALGEKEEKVSFLGRLATYRYMDMHQVIGEALDFSDIWCDKYFHNQKLPNFPV